MIATVLLLIILLVAALATGALLINLVGLARAMARLSSASAYTVRKDAMASGPGNG